METRMGEGNRGETCGNRHREGSMVKLRKGEWKRIRRRGAGRGRKRWRSRSKVDEREREVKGESTIGVALWRKSERKREGETRTYLAMEKEWRGVTL
jgi:hypothetical protein